MGLKVTRTTKTPAEKKDSPKSISMSSSLISGRYAFTPVPDSTPPGNSSAIVEKAEPDKDGHLNKESTTSLFDRLWEKAEKNSEVDLILDMDQIHSVESNFTDQLKSLRRHLGYQKRKIVLWRVQAECEDLLRI